MQRRHSLCIDAQLALDLHRFALYEPVQFIKLFLADKLEFSKVNHHCRLCPFSKDWMQHNLRGQGGT